MVASSYDPAKYDGTNASLPSAVSPDRKPKIGVRYRIAPCCGVAVRLQASQQLQSENTQRTQVRDLWAYLAAFMGQFLSMSHCLTWLQSVSSKISDRLVTNHRQPVLEIISDTSPGLHDTVMSCCDLMRRQLLGCMEYHDNCTDNRRRVLNATGCKAPYVPGPFNLWMNIPITPDGPTSFQPTLSSLGDAIGIRAIEDLVVVMSACPQGENPINGGVQYHLKFILS